MNPQAIPVVVIVAIIFVAAFIYDKKKADKIRAKEDEKFQGKHVYDFSNMYCSGFIADNKLVIKDRVKGYIQIDLKKVKTLETSTVRINGVFMTNLLFYDENGKSVENSKQMKQMSPKAADELIENIIKNAGWIQYS